MRALRDRRVDQVKFSRRHFLHLTAGAVALPAMLRLARAQTYAARPVHLIVGWPPGGAADLLARLIGQPLSQRLGQSLIIENRPGAGSNIATEAVVRAVPNGARCSTFLRSMRSTRPCTTTLASILSATPVASLCRGPGVLVVH